VPLPTEASVLNCCLLILTSGRAMATEGDAEVKHPRAAREFARKVGLRSSRRAELNAVIAAAKQWFEVNGGVLIELTEKDDEFYGVKRGQLGFIVKPPTQPRHQKKRRGPKKSDGLLERPPGSKKSYSNVRKGV
jgi:hypothetical protein